MVKLNPPPSFDESILYDDLVLSSVKLPDFQPNFKWTSDKYWARLQHRNNCTPLQICKMLAILKHTRAQRKLYLEQIDTTTATMHLPKTNTILTNVQKLLQQMNSVDGTVPVTEEISRESFTNSSTEYVLTNSFILDVQVSVTELNQKTLHSTWQQELEIGYMRQVGKPLESFKNVTINTCLLWVPGSSTFYSLFARSPMNMQKYRTNDTAKRKHFCIWEDIDTKLQQDLAYYQYTLVPLPDTWLKFDIKTNAFNKSGLIKNVNNIHLIRSNVLAPNQNITYTATHYSPVHPEAPLCSSHIPYYLCQKLLLAAKTFRHRAKQYLAGDTSELTSEQIDMENILVIDVMEQGDTQILVEVMENNLTTQYLHTVIKITKTENDNLKQDARKFGELVREINSKGVRDEDGNVGTMHTFGLHNHNGLFRKFADKLHSNEYRAKYKTFYKHYLEEISQKFPATLSTMIQTEYSRGITNDMPNHPVYEELPTVVTTDDLSQIIDKKDEPQIVEKEINTNCVDGPCAVTASVDFASSQHLDIFDGSDGVVIWVVEESESVKKRYFLMSNLKVQTATKAYNGVAVRIRDGVMIAFDGRMIRHGTTETDDLDKTYGFHVASNAKSLQSEL